MNIYYSGNAKCAIYNTSAYVNAPRSYQKDQERPGKGTGSLKHD